MPGTDSILDKASVMTIADDQKHADLLMIITKRTGVMTRSIDLVAAQPQPGYLTLTARGSTLVVRI